MNNQELSILPSKAVLEFIQIHNKNTGVLLTVAEATPIAQRFFGGISTLINFKDIVVNQENK